jgi:2-keto-4-pentenoate hydratase
VAAVAGGYGDGPVRFSASVKRALERQLQVRKRRLLDGATSVGWKIAADMPGVTTSEGAGGRIFGYLTSETVIAGSTPMIAGPTVDLCAEVELAVEIAHDLPPDTSPAMALEAIARLAVALEIVDVDEQAPTADTIISNVFHRAVSFGPLQKLASVASVRARLEVDGRAKFEPLVELDPTYTVWAMARLLGGLGEQLRAGDRVIGGSLIHRSIQPGHRVTAAIAGLGETSIHVDP